LAPARREGKHFANGGGGIWQAAASVCWSVGGRLALRIRRRYFRRCTADKSNDRKRSSTTHSLSL